MIGERAAKAALALVVGSALAGCAATVSCPETPPDPRAMFLLDHGRHASLVVTTADGPLHRYSYGDRRWYAEGDTGIGSGFMALFRKTPAVLLRQRLAGAMELPDVVGALDVETANAYAFTAPGPRIDALVGHLDAIHAEGAGDPGPEFAPHPTPYTVSYNSNHVVADWLEALGCDVSGSPMLSRWNVR